MEGLRNWVVTICTTVFFITAVEMILPSNNLKKYAKFVLGLILMTVIINPLVKLLNEGVDVTAFINRSTIAASKSSEYNIEELRDNSINETLSVFKYNIEKICENKFKQKFPKHKCKIEAQVEYNDTSQEYILKHISIGVNNNSVDKIQKVEVSTNGTIRKNNEAVSKYGLEVKEYLSDALELPIEQITVYKLDQ